MSFWRTSRLSDGRISFSQASTGGKNNPLPPYDTILPPTGIHPYLREIEVGREIDHRSLEAQREEKLDLKERALERGDTKTAHELQIEAVELDRDPLPDIGWKAWGMERRGIQTTAGDLWRDAYGRLEQVREVVSLSLIHISEPTRPY